MAFGQYTTQHEIVEKLGINQSTVSFALVQTKPKKKEGRLQYYDTREALQAVIKFYERMVASYKEDYEAKVAAAKKIIDMAESLKTTEG